MKHVPRPAGEPLIDAPLPPTEQYTSAPQALAWLRTEAAAEIERLLSFLDEIDGEADLEPSLGSPESWRYDGRRALAWAADDREDDADLESTDRDDDEEGFDAEPSLGSSNDYGSGVSYGSNIDPEHRGTDLEDGHDGSEPDVEGEPALGSFDRMMNQEKSWKQSSLFLDSTSSTTATKSRAWALSTISMARLIR
jgi:hypothetical protein